MNKKPARHERTGKEKERPAKIIPQSPPSPPEHTAMRFENLVLRPFPMLTATGGAETRVAPLAMLDYSVELSAKQNGLFEFWRLNRLPGKPESIVPSPKPRHYRTTTKRKCFFRDSRLSLGFEDERVPAHGVFHAPSLIEPPEHAAIYHYVLQEMNSPALIRVAPHLNYLVIRGTYTQFVLILNLDRFDAEVIRKLKILCARLEKAGLPILSAFAFEDPSRSRFYLDSGSIDPRAPMKKFFGPDFYSLRLKEHRYSVHPLSFSQVNESMVGSMLDQTRKLLSPPGKGRLLDLYCGYGLFAHFLSNNFEEVIGIDSTAFSIDSAIHNRKYNPGRAKTRFLQNRITVRTLEKMLPEANKDEWIVLDPPRHGTDKGVIEHLAQRGPKRVVHVFCSVDEIPHATIQWKKAGYWIDRIVPLDMFPGTPNLEVLVALSAK